MNFNLPLVSIIIPLYNSENYIAETISSAINQTWTNTEIIIVDDGSTDNSFKVAKKFEADNVIILQQKNKGASAARNLGLKKAKGLYIQFLDADDLLSLNKIEAHVKMLDSHVDKLIIGPMVYFQDGSDPYATQINHEWYRKGSKDMTDFITKLYGGDLIGPKYGGMITIHSWLTPRHIIDKAGLWNEQLCLDDDGEFFCRAVLNANEILYADNAISYYRKQIKNSLSSQRSNKSLTSLFNSTLLKKEHLLSRTDTIEAKKAISKYFWEVAIVAYPKSIKIAKKALDEANKLAKIPHNYYRYTPFYKIISFLFGWKTSAWISYIKHYNK